jgi:hypothetical protein
MLEEKLDPAQVDSAGTASSMFVILEKQKILAQFFFADLVWRFLIVPGQLAHSQQIGFLGPDSQAAQLHVLDHLLLQWCSHN